MMLRKVRLAAMTATALLLGLVPAAQSAPLTFAPPVNASPPGVNAQDAPMSVVNSDGSITVAWRTIGRDGILQAARSTDKGQTWSAPIDIAVVRNRARLAVNDSHLRPPPDGPNSTTSTNPRLASDPFRPGWIYIVYGDTADPGPTAPTGGFNGSDHFINYDSQVYFQRSKNNGLTWSTPKRISTLTTLPGSLTHQTRQPHVSVSPGGRVNVVWQDRRHWYMNANPLGGNPALERDCTHSHIFCEDIRLGDTYLSTSTDGGDNFSPNIRVSDRSHNNDVGYDTRPASGYWSWGPQSVTVSGGQLLVGWMDSREGNWDTDTEDFYLSKVNFDATSAVPQTAIPETEPAARSVALSKLGYMGGNEGALVGGARDPANISPTPLAGAPGGPASRNASRVVIVNETDVPSAMAATVLARANPAPVLLSPAAGLPASVKDEIKRIRPAGAFVIGDATKLSAQVVTDIGVAGGIMAGQITRLSGTTDADTAAIIANALDPRVAAEKTADIPAFDAAIIANPATPDAAAAVGLAAARRLPLLYVGQNSVPPETSTAIDTLDIKKLIVVGETDEVSADVVTTLDALPKVTEAVTRRGGATQYDTSKEIVTEAKERGMPSNVVYAADGTDPMGATLLGGVVARATGMLVLAPAPLSTAAPTQATASGLTGISRFFLLGPAGAGGGPTAASIRPGPNYNLASDPSKFRGRDQIGLAVNRTDPSHVVSVNANYLDLECEASVSRDGGTTWSRAVPLLPADPPAGQAPYSKRCAFHQNVVFGSGQNVYAIVTATRTGPLAPSSPDAGVLVYKSEDGGTTWQRGVPAMLEGAGSNDPVAQPTAGPSYNRPSIAVAPGAAENGDDLVYAVGRDFIGTGNSGTAPACTASCGSVKVAVSTIAPPVTNPPPPATTPPPPPDSIATPPPVVTPPPPPPPPPPVVDVAPALSKVSLSSRAFKARSGTRIRLTLSEDARVSIVVAQRVVGRRIGRNCVALTPITRRRAPCVRYQTRGTIRSNRKAGANTIRFTGRINGRLLKPASYRFTIQATADGKRSKKVNLAFRIVR